MNQPDRYSRFTIPEGQQKVDFVVDATSRCAATYTIRLEDHTVGNLLRQQLHSDDSVVFAGYRIPHPLDPLMVVRIQTTENKMPHEAMDYAIQDLRAELRELKEQLQEQVPRPHNAWREQQQRQQQEQQQQGYPQDPYTAQGGGQGGYGYGYQGGY